MELLITTGLLMLVVGILAGRWSAKTGGSDSGGMQFMLDGQLLQVEGWVLRIIWFDVMDATEREAMTRIDRLWLRGKQPSPEQLAYSQTIWLNAFKRWLTTQDGQTWASKHAPYIKPLFAAKSAVTPSLPM